MTSEKNGVQHRRNGTSFTLAVTMGVIPHTGPPVWKDEVEEVVTEEVGLYLMYTSTTQARAFSVVGPSVWNGLPLSQRLLPRILSDTFYSSLKTLLFSRARVGSASE